jgi:hypothetical protein
VQQQSGAVKQHAAMSATDEKNVVLEACWRLQKRLQGIKLSTITL